MTCSLLVQNRMANRINILKLMQEMRGFADLAKNHARSHAKAGVPLHIRAPKWKQGHAQHKRMIRISMRDLPDIPHPVAINHLSQAERPVATIG